MDAKKIRTGVEGYDKMLFGGYVPNSVNLISGCSGTGKTIFAMSFVYQGAKLNEKSVYITLEEEKDQIIRNCKSIGIDLDNTDPELIHIFDIASLRKMFTTQEEFERKDSPLDIQTLIELIKRNCEGAKRIALDSLVPLSLRYPSINEFRSELFRLRATLNDLSATSLMTTEVPISSQDISRFGIEDFLADSVTVLRKKEDAGNYLWIHKMRGSDHIKDPVHYQITGRGLIVSYNDFLKV